MKLSEIITQAFRERNLIPIGKEPTPDEQAEALARLNNYIAELFGAVLGEFGTDWPAPPRANVAFGSAVPPPNADRLFTTDPRVWAVPEQNVRVLLSPDSNVSLLFPAWPSDGARMRLIDVGTPEGVTVTLEGQGRVFLDGSGVTFSPYGGPPRTWFYRADLGGWLELKEQFSAGDDSPFPAVYDDLLITGLALRLLPRFGGAAAAETIAVEQRMLSRMRRQYAQEQPKRGAFNNQLTRAGRTGRTARRILD